MDEGESRLAPGPHVRVRPSKALEKELGKLRQYLNLPCRGKGPEISDSRLEW